MDGRVLSGLYSFETSTGSWTHVPAGDAETARQGHSMGWVPGCQKLIVFGGSNGPFTQWNDIRVFDPAPSTWSSPATAGSLPPGRISAVLVWIPHQARFLLFGGGNGLLTTYFGDLWALELDATCDRATWTPLSPAGDLPSPRAGACAAYDETRRRLLLYGGETSTSVSSSELFELDVDSLTWTRVSAVGDLPGPSAFCATTFHEDLGLMLVHGGQHAGSAIDQTHVYDPSDQRWTVQAPSPSPGRLADSVSAYSPRLGLGVYFGGRYDEGFRQTYLDETWTARVELLP